MNKSETTYCDTQQNDDSKKEKRKSKRLFREIEYLLIKIIAVCLLFFLLFSFVFGMFRYNGNGMSPAIENGDLVAFYRLDKDYVASDTVVVKYDGEYVIGRVVAIAGDTVDIIDGKLYVNGFQQQERRIFSETDRYDSGVELPVTINEGEIFILGDNRKESTDSRIFGSINVKDTFGKVMTIIRRRGI